MYSAIPFPWSLLVLTVIVIGWLMGRWRGRRVSLSGLAICLGGVFVGIPVAHAAHIDGTPLLMLVPLAFGLGGAAAFRNWIASAVLSGVLALAAISIGEIIVIAVGCSFNSTTCV